MTTARVQVQYGWADGARIMGGVKAQEVGEVLARIVGPAGITPLQVVDEARSPVSPLHPAFEWDDEVAGEAWRIQQARSLVKSIRVVAVDAPPQIAYVSVMVQDDRAYVPYRVVADTPSYQRYALMDALRYLRGFEARFSQLQELAPVLSAIAQVRESLDGRNGEEFNA